MGAVSVNLIISFSVFVSAFIISADTEKRKLFWLRFILLYIVFAALRFLLFDYFRQMIYNDVVLIGYKMLICFVIFFQICVTVSVCYKLDIWGVLFCGNVCYAFHDLCRKIYHLIADAWLQRTPEVAHIALYLGIIILISLVLWLIMRRLGIKRVEVYNTFLLFISSILVTTCIVLNILSGPLSDNSIAKAGKSVYEILFIMITVLILCLDLGMLRSRELETERNKIKEILKEKEEQYYYEKHMIDMINIKCHDLKHQMSHIDGQQGVKLTEETRAVIEAYDSSYRTGNTALDVILTRKAFTCHEKGIELTCVADGKILDFISEVDIYSLFGNILDNAMEATEKLEDKTKRIISLSVEKNGYFVNLSARNYFAGKLVFNNGIPVTTKGDRMNHGFGIKSIRNIVEKYNGNILIKTNGDRFILDIMVSV